MITCLTIVSCILYIHLFTTKLTKCFVLLFLNLAKRIGASEGVFMCPSFDGGQKFSTLTVNHELADATDVGNVLAFLTTGLLMLVTFFHKVKCGSQLLSFSNSSLVFLY
jgi:hypothetical protein